MVNIPCAPHFTVILYLRLLSLVHQAGQQAFGMINDLRRRLSKRRVGIVAEGHDASIGDLLGRKSLNQNLFDLECVQVVKASPPRPCTATILSQDGISKTLRMIAR